MGDDQLFAEFTLSAIHNELGSVVVMKHDNCGRRVGAWCMTDSVDDVGLDVLALVARKHLKTDVNKERRVL